MITFDSKEIEQDFKAFPGRTDPRLVACLLQLSAMHNDWWFHITSGYRTPEHNKDVGGIPDSAHCTKPLTAFDLVVRHKLAGEYISLTDKQKIKAYLQFWWGDLFDWVIYNAPDEHIHLEVDKPFRKKLSSTLTKKK